MRAGRLVREAQRDREASVDTECPQHGVAYDENRRCQECRADAERELAAARPQPIRLDGCSCGGIGDTGAHRSSCQWSAR